ncbi:MAG: PfkB family carbohydrate kinase, partial [Cetobacterium sp.]
MSKIVTLGEIMLRLSTENNNRFIQSNTFRADYGGGEANVAVSLANFGIESEYVTKLPNNPLSDSIFRYLKANGVETKNIVLGGERLGTYYLEVGTSVRASSVIYDRKYSSFSTLDYSELKIEEILKDCKILHLSGITPALSENCKELTIKIMEKAKEMGVLISFDFNYRGKLWTLDEASPVLTSYLPYIDICFAGILDAKNIMKLGNHSDLNEYYKEITKKYP